MKTVSGKSADNPRKVADAPCGRSANVRVGEEGSRPEEKGREGSSSSGGGSSQDSEGHTESHAVPCDPARLADLLAEFGFWLGAPERRLAVASALAEDGCTQGALDAVCAYVERLAGHDPARTGERLARVLRPGEWREALRAAERSDERRAAAVQADPRQREPGALEREEQDRQRAAHDRTGMAAYAMLAYDHRKPADVALELGVSLDRLPALIRQGAAIYGADPDKAAELLTERKPKRRKGEVTR